MKLRCSIFLLALLVIKIVNSEDVDLVARAISGIIEEAFVKKSERIEIVSVAFGRQKNFDVLDEVLQLQMKKDDAYPIETRHVDLTQNWDSYINKSAIFFLESLEAFYTFNASIMLKTNVKSVKILFHNELMAEELIALSESRTLYINWHIAKMSFLRTRNGFVELYVMHWYAPGACYNWTTVNVNKFSGSTQVWGTKNFFVTSIKNFNGCAIVVRFRKIYESLNPMLFRHLKNGTVYKRGPLYAVFKILSEQLNFKLLYRTGKPPFDLEFNLYSFKRSINEIDPSGVGYILTTTFTSQHYIIITTLGELYTPLEKMFLPFDNDTWIGIGVVSLGAFILIFAAERAPIQIRKFMFGKKLRTPAINMLIGIMGGSQVFMPKRLWSRMALTIYLFMCLIIRNAYQQKTFEFLTSDVRRPPPHTLEDLIARNYTLYTHTETAFMIEALEPSRRPRMSTFEKVNFRQSKDFMIDKPKDPTFKAALLIPSEGFEVFCDDIRDTHEILWQPLKEDIMTVHLGIIMSVNDYLFDTFDQGIKKLLPTGMLEKGNIELEPPKYKKQEEDPPKKVLSMVDLELGFKIWFICLAIAFAVFVLEHVKFRLFDRKRVMKKKRKLERQNAIRRKDRYRRDRHESFGIEL